MAAASAFCMAAAPAAGMPVMAANAPTTIYGDVDSSGKVDIGDVITLQNYLAGKIATSNINMKYADVDKNVVIDVNDSKIILDYLIKKVTSLPYSESGSMHECNTYSFLEDETRSYVKYDCATGKTTTYSLPKNSTSSTRSGSDDRVIDSSANAQCIVRLEYPNGSSGSGFIIDDHIIATAGHCVCAGTSFLSPTIQIYDAGGTNKIKEYTPSELHIPTSIYNDLEYVYKASTDYGLIYVKEDLSAYGKMSLGTVSEMFHTTGQTVNVSGYPGTVHGVGNNKDRYYGTGKVEVYYSKPEQLKYTAYMSRGDSGGPVYIEYTLKGETFRSAIAINTSSSSSGFYGTKITQPLLRFYYNNPNID